MKRFLILISAVCLALLWPARLGAQAAHAREPITDAAMETLFAALAAKTPIQAQFTEHRWFPFRKTPVLLKGEMRFSKDSGLSLHYSKPEEQVVVADEKGLLLRDKKGKTRTIAADPRAPDMGSALMIIFRFDYRALCGSFQVLGSREGKTWIVVFTPLDARLVHSLGVITVSGEDEVVTRLEFKRSASKRIEILIGETRSGVSFDAQEMKRFFR